MKKRAESVPKSAMLIKLIYTKAWKKVLAEGAHDNTIGTYDALVQDDAFGIVTYNVY